MNSTNIHNFYSLTERFYRWGRVPLYTTHLFGQPTALATTAESIKQVCMNGTVFKSGWPKATRTVLGRKSFSVLEGDEHRRLRRLTAQGLQGQEALKAYIPRVEELVKAKLTNWEALGQFKLVEKLQQVRFWDLESWALNPCSNLWSLFSLFPYFFSVVRLSSKDLTLVDVWLPSILLTTAEEVKSSQSLFVSLFFQDWCVCFKCRVNVEEFQNFVF